MMVKHYTIKKGNCYVNQLLKVPCKNRVTHFWLTLYIYKTWKFSKIYGEIKLKQIQIECFSFYSFDNLQKTLRQTEN